MPSCLSRRLLHSKQGFMWSCCKIPRRGISKRWGSPRNLCKRGRERTNRESIFLMVQEPSCSQTFDDFFVKRCSWFDDSSLSFLELSVVIVRRLTICPPLHLSSCLTKQSNIRPLPLWRESLFGKNSSFSKKRRMKSEANHSQLKTHQKENESKCWWIA
jgi:hypothetical protein